MTIPDNIEYIKIGRKAIRKAILLTVMKAKTVIDKIHVNIATA